MLNPRGSMHPVILNNFEPFNVEEEWESYGDIVRKWRTRLTFNTIRVKGLKKPILPPMDNSQLIDIMLSTSKNSITLKIRTFDLYLIGYENEDGHWFEFKPEVNKYKTSEPLIPGSTFLPYGFSYGDLEGNARTERIDLQLGREQLMVAIRNLAQEPKKIQPSKEGKKVEVDQASEEKRAHGLLTIVLMVPEAIMFETMLTYASSNLTWNNNYISLNWKTNLTNEWQTLCKHITSASNGDFYEFEEIILQETLYRLAIKTIEDACKEVAILKKED